MTNNNDTYQTTGKRKYTRRTKTNKTTTGNTTTRKKRKYTKRTFNTSGNTAYFGYGNTKNKNSFTLITNDITVVQDTLNRFNT